RSLGLIAEHGIDDRQMKGGEVTITILPAFAGMASTDLSFVPILDDCPLANRLHRSHRAEEQGSAGRAEPLQIPDRGFPSASPPLMRARDQSFNSGRSPHQQSQLENSSPRSVQKHA